MRGPGCGAGHTAWVDLLHPWGGAGGGGNLRIELLHHGVSLLRTARRIVTHPHCHARLPHCFRHRLRVHASAGHVHPDHVALLRRRCGSTQWTAHLHFTLSGLRTVRGLGVVVVACMLELIVV